MDKSKICVSRTINVAMNKNPCKRKTNLLVYERDKMGPPVYKPCTPSPAVCVVPVKRIRVASSEELRRICGPPPCDYPRRPTLLEMLIKMIGTGLKMLVAGGVVYVAFDAGIFDDSERTEELWHSWCSTMTPKKLLENEEDERSEECQAQDELMCMLPPPYDHCEKMPVNHQVAGVYVRDKWNQMVSSLFEGIVGFPDNFVQFGMEVRRNLMKMFSKQKCEN